MLLLNLVHGRYFAPSYLPLLLLFLRHTKNLDGLRHTIRPVPLYGDRDDWKDSTDVSCNIVSVVGFSCRRIRRKWTFLNIKLVCLMTLCILLFFFFFLFCCMPLCEGIEAILTVRVYYKTRSAVRFITEILFYDDKYLNKKPIILLVVYTTYLATTWQLYRQITCSVHAY